MTVLTAQEQKRASLVKKGECRDVCGLRTPGAPQQAVALCSVVPGSSAAHGNDIVIMPARCTPGPGPEPSDSGFKDYKDIGAMDRRMSHPRAFAYGSFVDGASSVEKLDPSKPAGWPYVCSLSGDWEQGLCVSVRCNVMTL